MKRILLDQRMSPIAASILRGCGRNVIHVMECGLDRAEDLEILQYAREENRVCVTLDHDFHTHLARAQAASPSVVFIRIEGLDGARQALLLQRVWVHCADQIEAGAAVTVDAYSIRTRRLPLR